MPVIDVSSPDLHKSQERPVATMDAHANPIPPFSDAYLSLTVHSRTTVLLLYNVVQNRHRELTRTSATTEGPRDVLRQLKYCATL